MLCPYLKTEPVMPIQAASNLSRPVSAMREFMEVLLSAVLGTGLVLMLAPAVGPEAAAVVAVVHRAWLTLLEILTSLIGLLLLRRRPPAA